MIKITDAIISRLFFDQMKCICLLPVNSLKKCFNECYHDILLLASISFTKQNHLWNIIKKIFILFLESNKKKFSKFNNNKNTIKIGIY